LYVAVGTHARSPDGDGGGGGGGGKGSGLRGAARPGYEWAYQKTEYRTPVTCYLCFSANHKTRDCRTLDDSRSPSRSRSRGRKR